MSFEIVEAERLAKGDVIRFPLMEGFDPAMVQRAEICSLAEIGGYGTGVRLELAFKRAVRVFECRSAPTHYSAEYVSRSMLIERRAK